MDLPNMMLGITDKKPSKSDKKAMKKIHRENRRQLRKKIRLLQSNIKRKGQIVPRHLIMSVEPKLQHLITFGADVIVKGPVIMPLNKLSEGESIIIMPFAKRCRSRRTRRFRTWKGFELSVGLCLLPFAGEIKEDN